MTNIITYSILLLLSGIVVIAWLDKHKHHVLKYSIVVLYAVLGIYLAVIGSSEFFATTYSQYYNANIFVSVWRLAENVTPVADQMFGAFAVAFTSFAFAIIVSAIMFTVHASSRVIVLIGQLRNKHYTVKSKTNARRARTEYKQKRQVKRIFLRYCRLNN